jgi:hypothetical protein
MFPIGTPVEIKAVQGFTPRCGRVVSPPFPLTRPDGRVVEGNYAVELKKGFYPKDGNDFFVSTVIVHKDNMLVVKFPCTVCGRDLEFDRPSGVCSTKCLNEGQGFAKPAA